MSLGNVYDFVMNVFDRREAAVGNRRLVKEHSDRFLELNLIINASCP
jgi:hypothetical protein